MRAYAGSLIAMLIGVPMPAQEPPRPAATARTAAHEIMKVARYATLVTLGRDGHPQARIVDPLVANDQSIWIATNPLTRKVGEIRRDARVTLMFFNPAGNEYVSVLGTAALVTDSATRAKHWKPEWAPFYKAQSRGPDFMLFRVRPFRYEVSSGARGVANNPRTWRPVVVNLP